jgi:hypothetical protein
MRPSPAIVTIVVAALLAAPAAAQRERTRLNPRRSTAVTEAQATELTLTLNEVAVRPLQVWVRTAGQIDESRRVVTVDVPSEHARRVKVGQRARAFSPESRSRMHQAEVSQVLVGPRGVTLKATLAGQALETSRHYVLEIVTEDGEFLSVPNEAIIESGGKQLVYVHEPDGGYGPREIKAGRQGELYTQVLEGVKAGEQVVSFGSFFIDAEHRLKGS